jgi:hypothetical protein
MTCTRAMTLTELQELVEVYLGGEVTLSEFPAFFTRVKTTERLFDF